MSVDQLETGPPAAAVTTALPAGAVRMSHVYWDAEGRKRTSRDEVPVDEFGRLAAVGFKCRQCVTVRWMPASRAPKGDHTPVCEIHNRRMAAIVLRRPPILPFAQIWDAVREPLRPVWALPAVVAAGVAVDAAAVPALPWLGLAPLAGVAAARLHAVRKTRWHVRRGNLDADDPGGKKRIRDAIDRAARRVGYVSAAATGWLAIPAAGIEAGTAGGVLTWTSAGLVWLVPAASWWKTRRDQRQARPVQEPVVEVEPSAPSIDAEEAHVRKIWDAAIGCRQGEVVGVTTDGRPVVAKRDGRLAGCRLDGWRKIRGGWAAVIVGPPGVYESENFIQAKGKIAGSYSVSKAMVTLVPDGEDENRCEIMVQKAGVIKEPVRWAGPDSINTETGQAPLVRYLDGTYGMYELWRPGWGCAHELYVGTTGAGKTEALQQVFTIDRWAHHNGKGLIADFLIDPQQGQSFSAFQDDLAAPIADTADSALMLARAFRNEMLRRNAYLSKKEWVDDKGRKRKAVKWWNPLEDGPILCLNIDEAHEFLAIKEFAVLITAGGRMFRKCGMRIRILTHTPLLTDLGGSMALRDMLTGGFVWCGRTANGLTGATAFNGRLPADPRSIPEVPGAAYIMSAVEKRGVLARTMWEPDFYDWVRDSGDRPIGYPAEIPQETLSAFGPEYASWLAAARSDDGGLWTPSPTSAPVRAETGDEYLREVLANALLCAETPLDMNGIDCALSTAGVSASTLAVRQALSVLAGKGQAVQVDGCWSLHPAVVARLERELAATALPETDVEDEELEIGGAFR